MLVQNVTEAPSKDGNLLKLEVEIDQKNVFEVEHVKLGDRFDKVCLKLSKSGWGHFSTGLLIDIDIICSPVAKFNSVASLVVESIPTGLTGYQELFW